MQPIHEVGGAGFDVLAHGQFAIQLKFLGKIADAQPAPAANVAGIGGFLSRENPQDTGLSATVPTDQADFFSRRDR